MLCVCACVLSGRRLFYIGHFEALISVIMESYEECNVALSTHVTLNLFYSGEQELKQTSSQHMKG